MIQILTGSILISVLHAIIPNHWLPVLAIGRKEGWSLAETSRINRTLFSTAALQTSSLSSGKEGNRKENKKSNYSCLDCCHVPFSLYGNRGLFSFSG